MANPYPYSNPQRGGFQKRNYSQRGYAPQSQGFQAKYIQPQEQTQVQQNGKPCPNCGKFIKVAICKKQNEHFGEEYEVCDTNPPFFGCGGYFRWLGQSSTQNPANPPTQDDPEHNVNSSFPVKKRKIERNSEVYSEDSDPQEAYYEKASLKKAQEEEIEHLKKFSTQMVFEKYYQVDSRIEKMEKRLEEIYEFLIGKKTKSNSITCEPPTKKSKIVENNQSDTESEK